MATNHGLILHDPKQTPRGFEIIPEFMGPLAHLARRQNTIYCAKPDGGVLSFDTAHRRWAGAAWENREPVTALAATDSRIWVGTDSHLYGLADQADSLRVADKTDVSIRRLLADGDTLWIAAANGIYRHTGTTAPVLQAPVVPARQATALVTEGRNQLFAANEEGLWCVNLAAGNRAEPAVVYDLAAHIDRYPITDMAIINEQLYISTSGGGLMSIYVPGLNQGTSSPPAGKVR